MGSVGVSEHGRVIDGLAPWWRPLFSFFLMAFTTVLFIFPISCCSVVFSCSFQLDGFIFVFFFFLTPKRDETLCVGEDKRKEDKKEKQKRKKIIIIKRNENMVIAAWLVWSDDCCCMWNCFSPIPRGSEPSEPIGCQDVVPCCWAPIGTTSPPPPPSPLATSPRRNV